MLKSPHYLVLYSNLETAEGELPSSLEEALEQIQDVQGTFEPQMVLELTEGGTYRDVSEDLARLWAKDIAANTRDVFTGAAFLPKFVTKFISEEDFIEEYATDEEKHEMAREYAVEMRYQTDKESF